MLAGSRLATLLGPDKVAADAFEPETIDRIFALT